MFITSVNLGKLGIFIWESMATDPLLDQTSTAHLHRPHFVNLEITKCVFTKWKTLPESVHWSNVLSQKIPLELSMYI